MSDRWLDGPDIKTGLDGKPRNSKGEPIRIHRKTNSEIALLEQHTQSHSDSYQEKLLEL